MDEDGVFATPASDEVVAPDQPYLVTWNASLLSSFVLVSAA